MLLPRRICSMYIGKTQPRRATMDRAIHQGEPTRFHYRAEEVKRNLGQRGQTRYPLGRGAEAEITRAGREFYFADLYVRGNRVESQDRPELAALLDWAYQTARRYR
jgi:hypothetical protein